MNAATSDDRHKLGAMSMRARIALAVLFMFGAVALRVLTSVQEELGVATQAEQAGKPDAAIVHYRRAARWYLPFSPYHVRALDALATLGEAARTEGNVERALMAYRAVRGSIMASRSFYIPEHARLSQANARIAALMAEQPAAAMDAGKSKDALRAAYLAELEHDADPSTLWSIVLLLGFFGWVFGVYQLAVRGLDDNDAWVSVEVRRWSTVIAVGFGMFALGLALA